MKKGTILQAKLNALDSTLFPVPLEASHNTSSETEAAQPSNNLPDQCFVGINMLKYYFRPLAKRGFDDSECGQALDIAAVHAALRAEKPEAFIAAELAHQADVPTEGTPGAPPAAVTRANPDDVAVTFLGTGAAVPSKYRNVTGILLDLPSSNAALLMDCGEGSLGQMCRRFGRQGADDVLRRLAMVWISHIHADHHVGLPALLAARTRLLGAECPPLLVVGPRPLRRALVAYANLEPMRFQYVEASETEARNVSEDGPPPPQQEIVAALCSARKALGVKRLESIRVVHCAHSYGLVLESAVTDGWKIVFSGDTRPCDALIEGSKGATLLIHEATFDDSMQEEAIAKKHCTTKEAVEAGVASGAYRTLLTHFSQRYPKVPLIDENFVDHVGIAFDLMTVRLVDLPRLPGLVPAFKMLFDEEGEGDGEDAEPEPHMLG